MKKTNDVLKTLRCIGYEPKLDEDGDIEFMFQLKKVFVIVRDDAEHFAMLFFPEVSEIIDGKELEVLATCNKVNRDYKGVKLVVDSTHRYVQASCEFFYTDANALEMCLREGLTQISAIRSVFSLTLADVIV